MQPEQKILVSQLRPGDMVVRPADITDLIINVRSDGEMWDIFFCRTSTSDMTFHELFRLREDHVFSIGKLVRRPQ